MASILCRPEGLPRRRAVAEVMAEADIEDADERHQLLLDAIAGDGRV